ncbi:MAG: PqqD family protein [Polyangia bacterium]|jgi:hypothetical protein|nr:PqqD family protein [Polyangia bacterium]
MTDAELLTAVPRPLVGHEVDEVTGLVILLQPRFRWRWLERLMAPSPDKRHVRIHLDSLGSFLWLRMDGQTPLGDLAASLGERFPEEPDPKSRLCLFARQLAGTRLVELGYSPAPA